MKWFIFTFILLPFSSYSQDDGKRKIDSLVKILTSISADTTKANVLNTISLEYGFIDLELSQKYAQQALEISENKQYTKGIINANIRLGKISQQVYKLEDAKMYFSAAIEGSKKIGDQVKLANSYYNLGNVHNDLNSYATALENYFSAARIFEKLEMLARSAIIYCEVANVYRGLDEFEKSKYYLDKSTAILFELKDEETLIHNYISYAQLYDRLDSIDKIEYYASKTYELAKAYNDEVNGAVSVFALGIVDKRRNQFEKAISKFEEAIEIFEAISSFKGAASAYNEIGYCYAELYKKGKDEKLLKKAKWNFEKSITLYSENELIDGLPENYASLSEINELEGDFKSSLKNYKLFALYTDSISKMANKETIKNLEDKREIELRDKEIELNKLTLAAKERQTWLFIAGILLLAIIGLLLFYQNKIRLRNNKKLQILNQDLDQANKIKTRFFSILNHDLRSPVANLIHFLHLQKENPELLDEETKNRMQNSTISGAENLLSSMEDILLWSKGQMENFKPEPSQLTVYQLFEDTKKVFSGYQNIKFQYLNPDNLAIFTDENYLKTIVRNLTSNAINAFTKTKNPNIIWKAFQENGKLFLSISDNGPGATKDQFKALYDDKEVVGIKSGLGLHLIRDLAKTINCTITVNSIPNEGTTFILSFEDYQ